MQILPDSIKNFFSKTEAKSDLITSASPYGALIMGESGSVYYFDTVPTASLVKYYEQVPPLNAAVNRKANAVGSLPLKLINRKTKAPNPDHPAYKLLERPNKRGQKIRYDYFRDYTLWRTIAGNAYLTATGNITRPPLELFLLNPQNVSFQSGYNGYADVLRYTADTTTEASTSLSSEEYAYDRKTGTYVSNSNDRSVYHIHTFNPDLGVNDYEGKSELSSLYYAIQHYIVSSQHNLSLLDNGARPSGAFVLTQGKDGAQASLNDDEFKRLKAEIAVGYTGAGNAGRPMLLEGGLEWKPMQTSPKDLDFYNLRLDSEEMIYKALNIPVQLMMSQKVTANNLSNFRLEFYENCILPLGDNLCSHLNNFVLSRYRDGDQHEFIIDRDQIDVLQPQRIEKRKSIENSTTLTVNEKRKIFNDPEIEGGNKIVDPNGRPIAGPDAEATVEAQPAKSPAPATPSE